MSGSSPLVDYLRTHGHVGQSNAVRRATVAEALGVSSREVRAMAEATRRQSDPAGVVGFCCRGVFVCATADELLAVRERILRECRRRLAQLSAIEGAVKAIGQGELRM